MAPMEAWLAELEMEASFKEHQLTVAAILGEVFPTPYPPQVAGDSTASSQGEFGCNDVKQLMETHHISDSCGNHDNDNDNDKVDYIVNSNVCGQDESHQQNKQEAVSVGTKRKRLPHKVQDHIIAERKRRELITQMFISLSTLVPGLKKDRPYLIERIKGCIVDSGGDPELNPKVWAAGFTAALLKKRNTVVVPSSKNVEPSTDKNKSNVQEKDPLIVEALVFAVLERMFSFLFKLPAVNQRLMEIIHHLSENQPPCPQLYLYSTADKVIPYRSVVFYRTTKVEGKRCLVL